VTSQPFILLGEAHCLGDQVISFCRQNECLPAVSCQSAQLLTVMELVALGRGISLIPAMARERDGSKRREYRSIRDRPPSRVIAMVWHKDRFQSPLVRALVESVRTCAAPSPPS
jgi:LysR family hydrogen peroxide-inducible transcriptional activator